MNWQQAVASLATFVQAEMPDIVATVADSYELLENMSLGDDVHAVFLAGDQSSAPLTRKGRSWATLNVEVIVLSEEPVTDEPGLLSRIQLAMFEWIGPQGEIVTQTSANQMALDKQGRSYTALRVEAVLAAS